MTHQLINLKKNSSISIITFLIPIYVCLHVQKFLLVYFTFHCRLCLIMITLLYVSQNNFAIIFVYRIKQLSFRFQFFFLKTEKGKRSTGNSWRILIDVQIGNSSLNTYFLTIPFLYVLIIISNYWMLGNRVVISQKNEMVLINYWPITDSLVSFFRASPRRVEAPIKQPSYPIFWHKN